MLEADAARASVQTIHDTEGYAEAETEKYEWQYPLAALHVGQFFVMSLIQDLEWITAVVRFEEPVLCTIISSLRLAHVFAKFPSKPGGRGAIGAGMPVAATIVSAGSPGIVPLPQPQSSTT